MRTHEEWSRDFFRGEVALDNFIRAIQSDASRSAARSERERCAKLMDEAVRYYCGRGGGTEGDYWHEYATGAMACVSRIKALPDVGDGEGEA